MGSEQRSMTADEIRERECALLEAVVGLLGRIEEDLFFMRTQSPWLTLAEADRYSHLRNGVIGRAVSDDEMQSYQRDGGRTILVEREDVDDYIRTNWRNVRDDTHVEVASS